MSLWMDKKKSTLAFSFEKPTREKRKRAEKKDRNPSQEEKRAAPSPIAPEPITERNFTELIKGPPFQGDFPLSNSKEQLVPTSGPAKKGAERKGPRCAIKRHVVDVGSAFGDVRGNRANTLRGGAGRSHNLKEEQIQLPGCTENLSPREEWRRAKFFS